MTSPLYHNFSTSILEDFFVFFLLLGFSSAPPKNRTFLPQVSQCLLLYLFSACSAFPKKTFWIPSIIHQPLIPDGPAPLPRKNSVILKKKSSLSHLPNVGCCSHILKPPLPQVGYCFVFPKIPESSFSSR